MSRYLQEREHQNRSDIILREQQLFSEILREAILFQLLPDHVRLLEVKKKSVERHITQFGVILPLEVVQRRVNRADQLEAALRAELECEQLEEFLLIVREVVSATEGSEDEEVESVEQEVQQTPLIVANTGEVSSQNSSVFQSSSLGAQKLNMVELEEYFCPVIGCYITSKLMMYPIRAPHLALFADNVPPEAVQRTRSLIHRGDTLAAINGQSVFSLEDVIAWEFQLHPGTDHSLTILRRSDTGCRKVVVTVSRT